VQSHVKHYTTGVTTAHVNHVKTLCTVKKV
jgi:hypothetical protein